MVNIIENIAFGDVLIIYGLINLLALALFLIDKLKAKIGAWRIPEQSLILISFLGGGYGALLGLILFRHKIRKVKFLILIPLSALLLTGELLVLWIMLH